MKILLATSTVATNAGIPSFNRELCSLLGEENEVHLLVEQDFKAYAGYAKTFSTYGLDIFNYHDASKLLDELLAEHYDVVITSNSHIMPVLSAFMGNESRIITVSHSLGTMDCDNAVFNKKYIDSIVALSHSCKGYICKRFHIKNRDKVKVVYNSTRDNPNANALRNEKINNQTISIVFAGGACASKSPDIVLPVIKELCKTNLSFVFYWLGTDTPPLKKFQPYKDIRVLMPHDNRVVVKGRIPQVEANKLIESCNVFLAPSRREGFPMALLEALRVGCIPIVSDFKIANKEIIKDGKNGFVIAHKDIRAFYNRLVDIINNHSSYRPIYEESYKTFVDELSFPIWRERIKSVIAEGPSNHHQRKRITPLAFKWAVWKYKLLDRYNLIENHMIEVLPCAIKFYKFYKKSKSCQ